MKNRKGKLKIFMCLLSLMMIGTLLPTTVFAEGGEEPEIRMENGVADLTVNESKVAFAGHEWWVIGAGASEDDTNENESGVYPQNGSVTLLAVNNEFGNTAFNENFSFMNEYSGSTQYSGSTLQQKMEEIANEFQRSFPKEYAFINGRNLTGDDGIAGSNVDNQKLWALSIGEFRENIIGTGIVSFEEIWWLRSPGEYAGYLYAVDPSGNYYFMNVNMRNIAVRPALSLNLSSVLFTSDASETGGKTLASATSKELIKVPTLNTESSAVKFTMLDESQKLTISATKAQSTQTGEKLTFTYSYKDSGEVNEENRYVSCILTDSNGAVKYYGKLADISASENASGTITIPLSGIEDGTYTLKIFLEKINDSLYTDFCSEPVTMTVKVNDGEGTVSNFGGTIIHEHDWSDTWSSNETHHWHECVAADCDITDNSDKYKYEVHKYNQEVVSDEYLKEATCEKSAEYYYSCVCGKIGTETFTYGDPSGHDWADPEWTWEDDYSSAIATFTCKNDSNHAEEKTTTVTSVTKEATCTEDGKIIYTAKVTINEADYTDTQEVVLKATGHDWADPEWTWEDGYSSAMATFTCKNDSNHAEEKTTTVTSETVKEATETETGIVKYSATVVFEGKTYDITKEVEIPATGTVTPVEPENPTEPTDPANTINPVDTTNPTDTTNPAKPMDSTAVTQDTNDNVQTGDSTNFALWTFLFLAAGSILSGTFVYRKKKKYGR